MEIIALMTTLKTNLNILVVQIKYLIKNPRIRSNVTNESIKISRNLKIS